MDHPAAADPVVPQPIRLRLGSASELFLPASMPVAQIAQLVRAIEQVQA